MEEIGDGFDVLVEAGAHVAAGRSLLIFDRDKVAKAGYKDIVMCIVTNSDDYPGLAKVADGTVSAGAQVMQTAWRHEASASYSCLAP